MHDTILIIKKLFLMIIQVKRKRIKLFHIQFYIETKYSPICAGCNCQIYDQYLLKVAPDLEWHIQCLKCSECGQYLDESTTCFVLDGKTYCKYDYIRYLSICFYIIPTKGFYLKKLSQMIIISAVKKLTHFKQHMCRLGKQLCSIRASDDFLAKCIQMRAIDE